GQAWSDTGGTNSPNTVDPTVGDTGGCTNSSPQTTSTAPITTTSVGGPASYWQTYTYDLLGDRTSMVNHDTTGNAANNTTQTIAYPGTDGTTPATDPNQGGTVTTSNPTLGTTTETPTHTDTGYTPAENAGNTMSRKISTTGRVSTAFTLSGGGSLCIDDATSSTTPGNKVQVYTCNGTAAQNLTIGTDSTVRVLGMCLDTTGEATTTGTTVVINTCDTTKKTQLWKASQAGTLVNDANTGMCLTDPAAGAKSTQLTIATCGTTGQTWTTPSTATNTGAIPAGQPQYLTYDPEGRTSTVTTYSGASTKASSYLYDSSGSLLEQTSSQNGNAQTRVLYLFGGTEQITENVPNNSCTALRYYTGPDGTTLTRTSAGNLAYQVANGQGTAETAIDASTLNVTRRYYDPYGNLRGTQPSTWVSTDENHGYLGKPTDTTTGLDLLGARNYNPVQGRFTTPDPVFEAGDPNQMGGYTYAADNPATSSDPTGLFAFGNGCNTANTNCNNGQASDPGGAGSVTPGSTDTSSGNRNQGSSCTGKFACDVHNAQNDATGAPKASGSFWDVVAGTGRTFAGLQDLAIFGPTALFGVDPFSSAYDDSMRKLGVDTKSESYADGGMISSFFLGFIGGEGSLASTIEEADGAAAAAAEDGSAATKAVRTAPGPAKGPAPDGIDPQSTTAETKATSSKPAAPSEGTSGSTSPSGCSFAPTTPVLLVSGATEPIGKLKVGDRVEAADPKTGKEVGGRAVQHIWINHDTDLLDVTVSDGNGHTSVLHTTANHPFWDDTTHTWVRADHLKAGHKFASTHGQHPTVVNTKATPGAANRWNLTIQQLHTYYVMAGTTPVLVHNTNCGTPVFRGTTKGFEGSPGTQRVGITPTSSDPGVAIIFATHSEQFGESVVQIATPGDLAGVPTYEGYIPSEAEVGVELSPGEFAQRASIEIPASAARDILGRMGISIPSRIGIEDLSPLLSTTPKLTPEQVSQFIDEAGSYSG
uniref:polymorphic toxin-type HINT domain-containing protein n=1 Tax=Streptacidiphilus neutrinimicus TaxID=105420 RepID=UPI00157ADA1E